MAAGQLRRSRIRRGWAAIGAGLAAGLLLAACVSPAPSVVTRNDATTLPSTTSPVTTTTTTLPAGVCGIVVVHVNGPFATVHVTTQPLLVGVSIALDVGGGHQTGTTGADGTATFGSVINQPTAVHATVDNRLDCGATDSGEYCGIVVHQDIANPASATVEVHTNQLPAGVSVTLHTVTPAQDLTGTTGSDGVASFSLFVLQPTLLHATVDNRVECDGHIS